MREKETTKEEGTTRKQKEGNRKKKIGEGKQEKKWGLFVENEAGMKDNAADWGLFCHFF